MALTYGFVKCTITGDPVLKPSRQKNEIQYHLHAQLDVAGEQWDTAINVGTNDADDLLLYRLVFDYQHPLLKTLQGASQGFTGLIGAALPALDFLRSDPLTGTGDWRPSDVMDGTESPEPVQTLKRLLERALASKADVYIFGRTYAPPDLGIHDVHMNQGSQGPRFANTGTDDNDHNDIWQDGAVLVDFGEPQWAAYFTAFTQQLVPTDAQGNPADGAHPMSNADPGSLVAAP